MKFEFLDGRKFGRDNTYSIILPIDQGVEHGPHAAFYATDHPEMLDVNYQIDYISELLDEGLISATALPYRTAKLLCEKYPEHTGNVIVKANHGNNLNKDLEPSQANYAHPWDRKYGGIGFTIYPGSTNQDNMIATFKALQNESAARFIDGAPKTVLWSYPRGGDFDQTSFETILHATYIAAQLDPSVIKVKLPAYDNMATLCIRVNAIVKASCGVPVVFSGGALRSEEALQLEAEAISKNGGRGMIIGRNIFQRKPKEAKNLLSKIHKVFEES